MRKVRELIRLEFEQDISARKAAKIVGIGKTAASQYISGFKASGLSPSAVEVMSDTELLNAINIKKESDNLRYKELSTLPLVEICNLRHTSRGFTIPHQRTKRGYYN